MVLHENKRLVTLTTQAIPHMLSLEGTIVLCWAEELSESFTLTSSQETVSIHLSKFSFYSLSIQRWRSQEINIFYCFIKDILKKNCLYLFA